MEQEREMRRLKQERELRQRMAVLKEEKEGIEYDKNKSKKAVEMDEFEKKKQKDIQR